jgi:PTS system ascorbate-specific IIB component
LKELKIQTVCGVGVGSSQFLQMQINDILKKNGITHVSVFCGDVLTATSTQCDAIFTQPELAETIGSRAKVPVISIRNYIDKKEISEKLLKFLETTN